jgi:hypothetical protein
VGEVPVLGGFVQSLLIRAGQVRLDVESDLLDGAGEGERGPVGVAASSSPVAGEFSWPGFLARTLSATAISPSRCWACSRKFLDVVSSIRTGATDSSIVVYARQLFACHVPVARSGQCRGHCPRRAVGLCHVDGRLDCHGAGPDIDLPELDYLINHRAVISRASSPATVSVVRA